MAKTTLIRQGDSLPFIFDLKGAPITNWICTIFVKQYPGDTALIEREVEANTTARAWEGFLTSAETAALAQSSRTPYRLIGKLTNASDGMESQIPIRFNVAQAWA